MQRLGELIQTKKNQIACKEWLIMQWNFNIQIYSYLKNIKENVTQSIRGPNIIQQPLKLFLRSS